MISNPTDKQKETSTHACAHARSCVFPLMRASACIRARDAEPGAAGGCETGSRRQGFLCRRLNSAAAAAESGSSAATPGKSPWIWEAAGLAQIIFDSFVSARERPSEDLRFAFESRDAQTEQAEKKCCRIIPVIVRFETLFRSSHNFCLLVNCVKGTLGPCC